MADQQQYPEVGSDEYNADLAEIQAYDENNKGPGAERYCINDLGTGWKFSSGRCGIYYYGTGILHYTGCEVVQAWCVEHQQ